MAQITLDRELVRRISKILNICYRDLETGSLPEVNLDEIQELDERLTHELYQSL